MFDDEQKQGLGNLEYTEIQQLGPDAYPVYDKRRAPVVDTSEDGIGQVLLGVADSGADYQVPALPYEWWIDKDGNVVPIAVSTNRNPDEEFEHRYKEYIRLVQRAAGGRPYYDPTFKDEAERTAFIAARRARARKRGEKVESVKMTPVESATLIADKTGAAIEKAMSALVAKLREDDEPPPAPAAPAPAHAKGK